MRSAELGQPLDHAMIAALTSKAGCPTQTARAKGRDDTGAGPGRACRLRAWGDQGASGSMVISSPAGVSCSDGR